MFNSRRGLRQKPHAMDESPFSRQEPDLPLLSEDRLRMGLRCRPSKAAGGRLRRMAPSLRPASTGEP